MKILAGVSQCKSVHTLEMMVTECLREGEKLGTFRERVFQSESKGALSNKESPESAAEQFSPQATGQLGRATSLPLPSVSLSLAFPSLPSQICVFACYFLLSTLFLSVLLLQLEQKAPLRTL